MDNSDLYKVWYTIMRALEYGAIKDHVIHLDQILEYRTAHHHIKYKGHKYYIRISKKT